MTRSPPCPDCGGETIAHWGGFKCPACFTDAPLDRALALVKAEILRAKAKHQHNFRSPHEAYGILLEEVDELWDEIKADHYDGRAQKEAMQVAAMAVRYMIEIPVRSPLPDATLDINRGQTYSDDSNS